MGPARRVAGCRDRAACADGTNGGGWSMAMSASKPRETLAVAATDGDSERIAADICVIGAGPGGLAVATAATAFGRSVVLIERHKVGGEALNYGCVPSRAMAAVANRAH